MCGRARVRAWRRLGLEGKGKGASAFRPDAGRMHTPWGYLTKSHRGLLWFFNFSTKFFIGGISENGRFPCFSARKALVLRPCFTFLFMIGLEMVKNNPIYPWMNRGKTRFFAFPPRFPLLERESFLERNRRFQKQCRLAVPRTHQPFRSRYIRISS